MAEEEGGEPIELPTEEDGTGGTDGAFGEQNSCSKSCWALRGVKWESKTNWSLFGSCKFSI